MNSDPNCKSCALVAFVVDESYIAPTSGTKRQLQPVIGRFAELSHNQTCNVCKFIVRKLSEDPRRDEYGPDCAVTFWQWSQPMDYTWSYGPLENEDGNCLTCDRDHKGFRLIDFSSPSSDIHHWDETDPEWINLSRVESWVRHCDTSHAASCHELSEWANIAPPSLAPLLLIDVSAKCIVEVNVSVSAATRYAALSYVWGRLSNVLEATKSNLDQLKVPGALSLAVFADTLPATVRDAISLAGALSIDYLWVDRLCIVQDDISSKSLQLEQMGAIYANAYMTFVAADGTDADYGLRGSVKGVSQPRNFQAPVLNYKSDGQSLLVEPVFELDYNAPEWQRRGWTFQERTLSRRNLVFQENRVFWECPSTVWTEEVPHGPGTVSRMSRWERRKPSSYELKMSQWPDLVQYELLVLAYNMRVLSFPSDGLNAFMGISIALSRSFRGGFLYGIPEYYFDIAMLWFPFSPIRRRLNDGKIDSMLPSWSWAGWEGGNINLSILPQLQRHINAIFGTFPLEYIEIYPMVNWFKSNLDTGALQRVDNGYYEAVKARNDNTLPLPAGWSRINITEGSDTGQAFMHDSIQDTVFTWPLHIPERPLPPSPGKWKPFLKFNTTRAYCYIESRLRHTWEGNTWNTATNMAVPISSLYNLTDFSGHWMGVLYSNDFDKLPAAINELCEVIIISGGVTTQDDTDDHNGLEEWAQRPEIRELKTYHFYNVLWIQWVDKIAYRKALGRVWKDAWDRQSCENVEVTLG